MKDKNIDEIIIKLLENQNRLNNKYKEEFEYLIYMHMFISKVIMIPRLNHYNIEVYKQYKAKRIKTKNNKQCLIICC